MNRHTPSSKIIPAGAILAAGTGIGFAGDYLLRAQGEPALNFFLLFGGLAASAAVVTWSAKGTLSREALSWMAVGLMCAAGLVWRGSDLVRFASFVAACTAFALPALHSGRAWVRRAGVFDVCEATVGAGLHAVLGAVRLIGTGRRSDEDAPSLSGRWAWGRTAVVGSLIAAVPLGVFGALFVSADEVFATLVGDFVQVDVQIFASHLLLTAVLSWLACGYLVGFATGTRVEAVQGLRSLRPKVGVAEVATALGLVDLLFLGFVVVQLRYLFGGGSFVAVTPGLTYAEYARAGFFQLVAAVALAIPWLLATHALLGDKSLRARSVFASFAGVQVLLLLVIVASAIQRMLVYQSVYGLTEDRIVVTATLGWLTVVVLWFALTVFSGRRGRFVFGALVSAFLLVITLQAINPAGWAARHNLDRAAALGEVDAEHLTRLGSDAVPLLIRRLGELSPGARCIVAERLLQRWGADYPSDWRSYNLADVRAHEAVTIAVEDLREAAAPERCARTEISS